MGYKISNSYNWFSTRGEPPKLCKVYRIEGIPFEVDYLTEPEISDEEIITIANNNDYLSPDELFTRSDYLISEMMHPFLFDLEIDNPEQMPMDYCS